MIIPLLTLLLAASAAGMVPGFAHIPEPVGRLYSHCSNVIPGLRRQALGVDFTKLDLLPLDVLAHDDGFRGPVITVTCEKGETYTIDGVAYDRPDQLWHVEEQPSGSLTATTQLIQTAEEARESLSVSAEVGVSTAKFGFSTSRTFSKMETTINQHEQKISKVAAAFSARRAFWLPKDSLQMDDNAKRAMENLPPVYLNDPHLYEEFIRQYGTHYIIDAKFGGIMSTYMETFTDYFESNTDTSVSLQAEATFYSILKAKGGNDHSQVQIDKKFTSNTSVSVRYYGGQANLMEKEGLSAWQPTISHNPWLYSGLLRPISDLFPDITKMQQMEIAVNDHILLAYLDVELPRIIHTLPGAVQGRPEAQNLLREINQMSKVRPLKTDEVEALGRRVQQTYIQLFLEYHADFDDFRKVNNFDQPLNFQCPGGKSITRIHSVHSNQQEDREWWLGCNFVPGMGRLRSCRWTPDYVNDFDKPIDFTCPGGGVMKGWHSYHQNQQEDRRWKYECCQVEAAVPEQCAWTGYLNGFDQPLTLRVNVTRDVITGVQSIHDNSPEDRRWSFRVCKQLRFLTRAEQDEIERNHLRVNSDKWQEYIDEFFKLKPLEHPEIQESQAEGSRSEEISSDRDPSTSDAFSSEPEVEWPGPNSREWESPEGGHLQLGHDFQ